MHIFCCFCIFCILAEPFQPCLCHDFFSLFPADATCLEVEQHSLFQFADGCAVAALDILFGAEDQRNGLVDNVIAQQQYVLFFLAL